MACVLGGGEEAFAERAVLFTRLEWGRGWGRRGGNAFDFQAGSGCCSWEVVGGREVGWSVGWSVGG